MFLRLAVCGWAALLLGLLPGAAAAQHITTAGAAGPRPLSGPNYLIGPSLGQRVGGNLFDSFVSFSLAAGQSATFTGPKAIANIIAGVTGGTRSTIDGTINSAIPGASLYLINPSGVVFGPRGTVNVTGSFYASTADYLKLGGNGRFNVTRPGGSKLTAAPPSAFGFLDAKPAAITVDGSALGPAPGTLGLVGGPVTVRNNASAQAGAIDLTAVAGKGAVPVDPRRKGAMSVGRFGRVGITGGSLLEAIATGPGKPGMLSVTAGRLGLTDGAKLLSIAAGSAPVAPVRVTAQSLVIDGRADPNSLTEIGAINLGSGSGGGVRIAAGSLRIVGGGGIASTASGRGEAAALRITARRLRLANSAAITSIGNGRADSGAVSVYARTLAVTTNAEISSGTLAGSHGSAGPVTVAAGRLQLVAAGSIASDTGGSGDAGNVSVTAHDLHLAQSGTIASNTAGSGNAGSVTVRAQRMTVDNGEVSATTFARGAGGDVRVAARRLRLTASGIIASDTGGRGDGGKVFVDVTGKGARALEIGTNGAISASTSGAGKGGRITVDVEGGLVIDGAGADLSAPTGITAQANFGSTGNAGSVGVTVRRLRLTGFGTVASDTAGAGNGGKISVEVTGKTARALVIGSNGRIDASTFGAGDGGQIAVDVRGGVVIDGAAGDPSALTRIGAEAEPGSTGDAGDVAVSARSLRLARFGSIESNTLSAGNGGRVSVEVTGGGAAALTIRSEGEIAAGTVASGDGGRVAIDVRGGLVIDGAGVGPGLVTGISAQANPGSTGNAGDVRVEARSVRLAEAGLIVSNTDGTGNGGNVVIIVTGGGPAAMTIRTNGEIGASTFGAGNSGRIAIDAAGGLTIDGAGADPLFATGIGAEANPGSTGNAGGAVVRSGSLRLVAGGAITDSAVGAVNGQPASTGNAGAVIVNVAGPVMIEGPGSRIATETNPGTVGNAGSVTVNARQITLAAGGGILSTTAGTGAGGPVSVAASGALLLDGAGNPATQIAASAMGPLAGPGGNVTVSAGSVTIENGAEIASATAGPGSGGDVSVTARSAIVLSGPGPQITALSTGSGNAGVVGVAAANLLMTGGAAISTQAQGANGGDITVSVGNLLQIVDSEVTTSVLGQAGNGGNIMIASGLSVLDDGTIKAQAVGGNGGNIVINKDAGTFVASTDSLVSASSQEGISGVITINGITPLNGTLVALSSELHKRAALTRNSCAARAGQPQSSLFAAGRGGLPQDPDASLPALYIAGRDLRLAPPSRADGGGERRSMLPAPARCG